MNVVTLSSTVLGALFLTVTTALAQGTWQSEGHLLSPRTQTAVAPLPDGRVLIVGGAVPPSTVPVASEIFDPASGTSVAVPMLNPRFFAGAVPLLDGRVLVLGGQTGFSFVVPAEIFDPATNSWSLAASPRFGATPPGLARLPDGRVFYGMNGPPEAYDPATNTWSPLANTSEFHLSGITMLLNDGRVLMAGGLSSPATETYNPATDSWSTVAPMPSWIFAARAVTLHDGRVLVAGGISRSGFAPTAEAFLFDPATNSWTPAGNMSTARTQHSLTLLPNGQVLAAGGSAVSGSTAPELQTAELYSPATNSWSPASPLLSARSGHAALLISDHVYLFGGRTATTVDSYVRNRAPSAHAGTDVIANGCLSCTTAVTVSAAASTDPDGDALTYSWSIDNTLLAESSSPTAVLPIGVGTHSVTLTVRDPLGLSASDSLLITVADVETAYAAQIAELQAALTLCEANGNVSDEIDLQEQFWQNMFQAPDFELPGATPEDELRNLLNAIQQLPRGQQLMLFRALSGR